MHTISLYYTKTDSTGLNKILAKYSTIVRRIAYAMHQYFSPVTDLEDMIQVGMIGLVDAYNQYSKSKGASFLTYAGIKIKGAILDDIRKNNWIPRSVYKYSKLIAAARSRVEQKLNRSAKNAEVAAELHLTLDQFYSMLSNAQFGQLCDIEKITMSENGNDVPSSITMSLIQNIESEKLCYALEKHIQKLSQKEKMILSLYYDNEFSLKDIGKILTISESRVCQMLNQITAKLKVKLSEWQFET